MPPLPNRRYALLTLAALASGGAGGCASRAGVGAGDAQDPSDVLASLPVQVLMTQGFAAVHQALKAQQIVPAQVLVEPGNGSVAVVAKNLGQWLGRGHCADLVIAPQAVMRQLLAQGLLRPGSLVDLVRTPVVLVVQAGRPVPQVQDAEQLRALLQRTPSLAYPSSDEGRFIEQVLLPQLGIKDAVLAKSIKAFGPQVAALVARGDAELGLQALGDLSGASGIAQAGPLPAPLGYATVYTAGIARYAPSVAGAQAVLHFYQRESALHDWSGTGWETVTASEPPARKR